MMNWSEKIIEAHTRVTEAVSHIKRMKSDRYFVWQEEGRSDLSADNLHVERVMRGSTDLYTKKQFDPWADEFEKSMSISGLSWYLNSIQYEEDTGFYHYEWVWEVLYGENQL